MPPTSTSPDRIGLLARCYGVACSWGQLHRDGKKAHPPVSLSFHSDVDEPVPLKWNPSSRPVFDSGSNRSGVDAGRGGAVS